MITPVVHTCLFSLSLLLVIFVETNSEVAFRDNQDSFLEKRKQSRKHSFDTHNAQCATHAFFQTRWPLPMSSSTAKISMHLACFLFCCLLCSVKKALSHDIKKLNQGLFAVVSFEVQRFQNITDKIAKVNLNHDCCRHQTPANLLAAPNGVLLELPIPNGFPTRNAFSVPQP